jgi:hypothetical protein
VSPARRSAGRARARRPSAKGRGRTVRYPFRG